MHLPGAEAVLGADVVAALRRGVGQGSGVTGMLPGQRANLTPSPVD
ncbi:hypothetical protein [Streptomyces sp. MZ04]|nr:hypothetical protein [Streptomyces sp. MZ04]